MVTKEQILLATAKKIVQNCHIALVWLLVHSVHHYVTTVEGTTRNVQYFKTSVPQKKMKAQKSSL
jgi:hypothetical protein